MSPDAEPIRWATEGDGPEPDLETVEPASDGCADPNLYGPKQIHVTVRLAGSGLTPDAAYTRQIYVGWTATPQPMRRLKLTLSSMRLGFDHDTGLLGSDDDCECSWFWMSVDRAPGEWRRLSDHADDDDPDEVDGNEHLNNFSDGTTRTFTGATWELTMPAEPNLQSFVIRAFGFDGGVGEDVTSLAFDQDCLDDHFAHHDIEEHVNLVPPFEFPDVLLFGRGPEWQRFEPRRQRPLRHRAAGDYSRRHCWLLWSVAERRVCIDERTVIAAPLPRDLPASSWWCNVGPRRLCIGGTGARKVRKRRFRRRRRQRSTTR